MRIALLAAAFLLGPAVVHAAAPQPVQTQPRAGSPLPPPQQSIIGLSLMDALVAVKGEALAGLFGYISEANAAPAFANYLFRNPKALKLLLKRDESDFKRAGGINEWDKEVFLYLITINSAAAMAGIDGLSPKLFDQLSTLTLEPGLSLANLKLKGAKR